MKKNILITGGAGLIGYNLAEALCKKHNIFILDKPGQIKRNVKKLKKLKIKKFYKGLIEDENLCNLACKKKDIIVHLAAMLGVKNTEENKFKCLMINLKGTENIFNASLKNKVKRFIFASSSEVYGEPKKNPINENFKLNGKSIYAISKILGEKIVMKNQSVIKTTIFRFFNTIGEGQVAQFVVTKFVKAVLENKVVKINGDGSQLRSYSNSRDIATGIENALFNKKTFSKIYNLGNSKEPISLYNLLKRIIKLTGKKKYKKIIYKKKFYDSDRSKEREIFKRYCSTNRAKKDFNFKLEKKLNDSLMSIINQKKIYSDWPK